MTDKPRDYKIGGWRGAEAFKVKLCVVCSKEFKPKSGYHKFCSETCKGKNKYLEGVVTTETQYEKISGNWHRYFLRLIQSKDRKNFVTAEDLERLLQKQSGKCALSGVTLTCTLKKGVKYQTNASLDRINPGGSYTLDNIQLVCSVLNKWRGDTPKNEFIEWCRRVVGHNDGKN